MPLKPVVTDLATVPEPFRAEYELRDGSYHLKLDGDPAGYVKGTDHAALNGKVAEFRENNIKILKALGVENVDGALQKLEALKAIDPAEYQRLRDDAAKLEKKGVKGEGDLQTIVQAALKPLAEKLEQSERREAEARTRADRARLREVIGTAALKAGAKPGAIDFLLQKAEETFVVEDGEVKARPTKFSPSGTGSLINVPEWLGSTTKEYDFAFEPNKGGGANPAGGGAGAPKPGVKQIVNPSPEDLGRLTYVQGKGLTDRSGQVVEIVSQQ